MTAISVSSEAGQDIIRRLVPGGDYVVRGIVVADRTTGKFRHILRANSQLLEQTTALSTRGPFEALRAVMSAQQIMSFVAIAQNAATAASLRRIEMTLESMARRLDGIEQRLSRIDLKLDLVLSALRDSPVARLKSAKNQGLNALRHADRTSLIAAAQNAEQAARELLAQANRLVRVELDGLPVAFRFPAVLADLIDGAAEAMEIASAMHLALRSPDVASRVLREAAGTMEDMRAKLRTALTDPELLLRRTNPELADTTALVAVGTKLHQSLHWMHGRALMIEADLITADPAAAEFEIVREVDGLVFETVNLPVRR